MTTYADGVFQYGGMPVTPFGLSIPSSASTLTGRGAVLFVDATNGTDGSNGSSPDDAVATIQRALDKANSGTGTTIFVMAGTYAENLTVTKDYVQIVGCTLAGYGRPDVTPATGVPITVTGQGFSCRHMRFAGTAADCAVQRGNGFEYSDCVFDGDGTAAKAGVRLIPSDTDTHLTASEGSIHGNLFRGNANGIIFDTGLAPAVGVGSTDNRIYENVFYANTLDLATADTGGGVYSVQLTTIGPRNVFQDKNKATYIDLTTTNGGAAGDQSGTIVGNWFATDTSSTTKFKMVGTAFTFMGNFSTVGVIDGSALD